jgi:hypothetical protein
MPLAEVVRSPSIAPELLEPLAKTSYAAAKPRGSGLGVRWGQSDVGHVGALAIFRVEACEHSPRFTLSGFHTGTPELFCSRATDLDGKESIFRTKHEHR